MSSLIFFIWWPWQNCFILSSKSLIGWKVLTLRYGLLYFSSWIGFSKLQLPHLEFPRLTYKWKLLILAIFNLSYRDLMWWWPSTRENICCPDWSESINQRQFLLLLLWVGISLSTNFYSFYFSFDFAFVVPYVLPRLCNKCNHLAAKAFANQRQINLLSKIDRLWRSFTEKLKDLFKHWWACKSCDCWPERNSLNWIETKLREDLIFNKVLKVGVSTLAADFFRHFYKLLRLHKINKHRLIKHSGDWVWGWVCGNSVVSRGIDVFNLSSLFLLDNFLNYFRRALIYL